MLRLKKIDLKYLKNIKTFYFFKDDLNNKNFYKKLKKHFSDIDVVIHLAGQAGVRYSIKIQKHIVNNVLALYKAIRVF